MHQLKYQRQQHASDCRCHGVEEQYRADRMKEQRFRAW